VSLSAPVRVRLRYPDLDVFVERFSPNVTRGGLFLASKSPRPVGDAFMFEVQLATGAVALAGEGKVIWIKEYNPAEPNKAHGMGVQFIRLDADSREVLTRMLKIKGTQRGPGAPRGLTQPLAPLASGRGANGSPGARARIDTGVDLAAEHGMDEATLRRALDRSWLPGRPGDEDLEALLRPEPVELATLAQALSALPRMLDRSVRRRTGSFRTLEGMAPVAPVEPVEAPSAATQPAAAPENGVPSATHDD
jgi:uncharacterized protein (TIGR02266 family)